MRLDGQTRAERPVQFVDGLGLSAEERAMILGGTAARLLRL
jgi:hypothetical protein